MVINFKKNKENFKHGRKSMTIMGLQCLYGNRPHRFLRGDSWAAHRQIAVNAIPNRLNYCVILIAHT
jgi:hypothetical protein